MVGAYFVYQHLAAGLPEVNELADYDPPRVTRVHAGDGRLLAEFSIENRVYVPLEVIPDRVREAFLSAEDKTFYEHWGIDLPGILRAAITNLQAMGSDRRPVGASTITQQVAKNFLLTNEVSIERKLKEMILATRIEQAFEKDRILELYLNEIYLGFGSYGVASASLNYFNKSLDELTISEAAFLAALPKAPNNYDPVRKPEAAHDRRDWVLTRMLEDGHITREEFDIARAEVLTPVRRGPLEAVTADYFAEEVRRELAQRFGEDALYKGGLSVRTSLDPELQAIATRVLHEGLVEYDRRHGWRGPLGHVELEEDWAAQLAALPPDTDIWRWERAVVLGFEENETLIGFADGHEARIPFAEIEWARPNLEEQTVGPAPSRPEDVLAIGDLVAVEALPSEDEAASDEAAAEETADTVVIEIPADGDAVVEDDVASEEASEAELAPRPALYALRQVPEVSGAIVAIDPHTGRVLALSGGWSYQTSEFNRATQALRQPGSAFKPFVYLAALENGYTPSTIILDGPIVIDQGPGLPLWKPENYSQEFYGPSTMRLGIEKSRNLMTVRLAQAVGMEKIRELSARFDVVSNLMPVLSMALGAGETTPLRLTTGYAMFVNGGKRIEASFIDRVQDRRGVTIFEQDERPCEGCQLESWDGKPPPELPDTRETVTDPGSAYQMVSLLEGVVQRGTGARVAAVGKPLAGKTGTTNESFDAWFVGFTPDLAVGVYVGFDQPQTLGGKEQGASAAAPIFTAFMMDALADAPSIPFRIPPGIKLVRVNAETGLRAQAGDQKVIFEAFKEGTEPTTGDAVFIEGVGVPMEGSGDIGLGIGTPTGTTNSGSGGPGGLY
ncbi:MAG: penicillin-binding protein 1A [Rhodospirillaceae bacterium]|nr:penicillin-binding protein 1A [Rhodospirillaceae bacterium]